MRGPAAVRASLVAAAAELFAARGTAGVSVRDIADRAGVNHGLIHHYFHSKQGLIDATLDELAAGAAKALAEGLDLSPEAPLARYLLVASRAQLDADATSEPEATEPARGLGEIVRRLGELRSAGTPGAGGARQAEDERLAAIRLAALLIGWLLFEPVLLEVAGPDGVSAQWARQELLATALR